MKNYITIGVLAISLLNVTNSNAQTLPTGQSIADKTYTKDDGISVKRKLVMELKDKRGKTRVRETISLRKYFDEEKRLAIFYLTPSSVKGTAFLTFDYPEASKDDDQWLYLPALRKTRRISAANRGDYFLGTDLTYEDIKLETRISREDYNYKTIGKETIDGNECFIIEGTPKTKAIAKELGYGKVKLWVDSKLWMLRKADSWDVAGNYLKTVVISDIREVQGIWTYHTIEVKNHKTSHETKFIASDIDYETVLGDHYFTKEALINGI
ncbi:MAG: outer membrane lipoprotein-sorting protein [Lutibacter sp.]|uniref:outer membrane lipoprotein-sorting protein n=1 Tax=Lutibacter sp. TaxID=1925666 RepID=UPI0019DB7E25|nr:outer membrane lipoprotein-sorting protein [Lutibacter sp.]NOR27276.1 outer membrane lipoprotein-sorting protein [Lutibacter sp.]